MQIDDIKNLLAEVQFPITKTELLTFAEQKGATELKTILSDLPEQRFASSEEVLQKLPLGNIANRIGM